MEVPSASALHTMASGTLYNNVWAVGPSAVTAFVGGHGRANLKQARGCPRLCVEVSRNVLVCVHIRTHVYMSVRIYTDASRWTGSDVYMCVYVCIHMYL